MKFPDPLVQGTLIKRYKRFLADVTLPSGEVVTAHTTNSGSMMGCCDPGSTVWLSPAQNPERKLKWTWELVEVNGYLVGVNTSHPNALALEHATAGDIPEIAGYGFHKREVKYGVNSRIDLLLSDGTQPDCYVEVKNVSLFRGRQAFFPDAVTTRGAKHLEELIRMVADGKRALMLYIVQRSGEGLDSFTIARDIDPTYANLLHTARQAGVEAVCYTCDVSPQAITLARPLPIVLD
jgi:sugar fermentation stimulation protein A